MYFDSIPSLLTKLNIPPQTWWSRGLKSEGDADKAYVDKAHEA